MQRDRLPVCFGLGHIGDAVRLTARALEGPGDLVVRIGGLARGAVRVGAALAHAVRVERLLLGRGGLCLCGVVPVLDVLHGGRLHVADVGGGAVGVHVAVVGGGAVRLAVCAAVSRGVRDGGGAARRTLTAASDALARYSFQPGAEGMVVDVLCWFFDRLRCFSVSRTCAGACQRRVQR